MPTLATNHLDDLARSLDGDILTDDWTRAVYATDASIYQIRPECVVCPRHADDVRTAVAFARKHRIPILSRGGGTSLAGQTVGASMVIDFSRYMNRILEVNLEERWARVEPGVVMAELSDRLAPDGLQFAPDPATATRANIGGMIGNNTAGTRSIIYGRTIDHVLGIHVLLADGTEMDLDEISAEEYESRSKGQSREAQIYGRMRGIVEQHRQEIETRYPRVMRRVSGYPLDSFTGTDRWNLAHILIGSEGTLGVTLEAKLHLEPLPKHTSIYVPHFADVLECVRAVKPLLALGPATVEILDDTVTDRARANLTTAPLCGFIEGDPRAILVVQFYGETAEEAKAKAESGAALLQGMKTGYAHPVVIDNTEQANVWGVRKHGLGLMLGIKGDKKPMPFIEDAAVPDDNLPGYIESILAFCHDRGVNVAMYAHASVGLIHVRPILDLRLAEDIEHLKAISRESFRLVKACKGAISGEHGDGLVRSIYNEEYFGTDLYQAFRQVKELFDPDGLMNPGKIVDPQSIDENLRFGVDYRATVGDTVYKYREDGSFTEAVHMCNGVGACRQTLTGVMCPSYIATRDERHSTRGRANALRMAMSGQVGADGMTDEGLHEILGLCLSCKACKSECPSSVDLAKLKSEFLQGYLDKHGPSLLDRLVAGTRRSAKLAAGPLAPLVNAIQGAGWFRLLLEKTVGVDRRRRLPGYARKCLASQLAGRNGAGAGTGTEVILFVDTFTNYYAPEVGLAAVELLEALGYRVKPFSAGCCQRTRISRGFLRLAKQDGTRTLKQLDLHLQAGTPVVALEPGCAAALTDDLPDLVDDESLAARAQKGIMPLEVFLAGEIERGAVTKKFTSSAKRFLVHGHCHQRALYRTTAMKTLLARVEGVEVEEVDSSCCGMAGAFGYEKENYEISRKCAERRLVPAVLDASVDTVCVAPGFSCRHQIADFTGKQAVHWVQAITVEE